MNINLLNNKFEVLDTEEKITIADSFVVRQNKIGIGNGEAKLYVGQESSKLRNFFGNNGFTVKCFLLKKDLLKYLEETKIEYLHPEQPYQNKSNLPNLWQRRKDKVDSLNEKIEFEITEQTQIAGPRIYVKSNDIAYKTIRELSLPNITYISILKLLNSNNELIYYFKLFADYFGEIEHPYIIQQQQQEVNTIADEQNKQILSKARVGQGKYRENLLNQCPFCPITTISDDRLLIASHIKPWAISNEFEKTDPYNGFMFTPTFDYLFDRGFISFTNDKKIILSPFLSKITYSKLGIYNGKSFPLLPIEGREDYLEFHRSEILK